MNLESLLNTTTKVKNFFRDVTSKPKTYTAKFLATTLLTANMLTATAQDPITISGRVTNKPHGAHPELKMQVWDKYTEYTQENVLDELFTNPEDGTFDLTILGTNTQNINQTQNKAYPNPFNDKINIYFIPRQSAKYQISITNILGQTIHQENKHLNAGNPLNLEAQGLGPIGVYFVNITSSTDKASYKIMQNQTNNNLQITTRNHAANDSPNLKMGDIQELYLKITGDAQHHDKDTILSFENHTGLDIKIDVIAQEILANYAITATNNPMNAPIQNGFVTATNEHGEELITQTINNGTAQSTYPQTEWIYAGDTIRHTNQINTNITAEHHHTQELYDQYNENLNIETVLEQISYEKTAELNMNFTSTPLMYAPTLDTYILNGTDTITETTITEGAQTIQLNYTKYLNGQDTLKHINSEPVSNITILAGNDKHIEQEYNIQFQDEMNLHTEIQQTPEQGETTIITNLTGNVFGEAPNGVSLIYKNNDNDELLTQGESINGEHTAQIPYQYWEHGELYHTTLNQIKQEITKPGVYEAIDEILNNENQTTNYTLTQIPQEKTAQIIGTVKTPAQIPVPGADVEILNEETQYATTTTLESGEFETTMQYTKYTNPENNAQTITEPTNIYAKITKDTYETTTTEPQSLEDIVNFGEITLTPEPTIKTLNFTFKPLTVMGDPQHPDNVIFVRLGDVVQSYVVGAQEEINVNITAETTDNHVTIWDVPPVNANDEPEYNETIIIHEQNRDWHKQPIANNNLTANRTQANQPYDTLQLNIDLIHNRDDLELLKMYNSFDHPNQGTIYTNKYRFAKFITGRSGGQIRSHQPTPEGNGWQIFMLTYNQANPDEEVSQQFIDNWTNSTNQVLNASIRNDGQKTFDWTPIYYVNTPTDPTYLAAEANDWINTLRIVPITGQGSATNSVSGGYTHHVWGRVRTPPGSTSLTTGLEEGLECTYRFVDPELGTTAYIIEFIDGQPQLNLFAKRAVQFRNQLQHGTTYVSPPSTND